jgi:hypothetical protein
MSTRTFLFCDICNPDAVRYVEQRRNARRGDKGKRITDGRSWYEGDVKRAVALYGWKITGIDKHACPRCVASGRTTDALPSLRFRR